MRLVTTLVVEVVHRNGKIICRVEVARVDVLALEQRCTLALCRWSVTISGHVYSKQSSYLSHEVLDGPSSTANAQVEGCCPQREGAEKDAFHA